MSQTSPTATTSRNSEPETRNSSLTEQIGAFLAATPSEHIPPEVVEQARVYVLDWLGSALAGTQSPPGRMLGRYAAGQPRGEATTFGLAEGRGGSVAALHNGAVSHVLEMDDLDRASVLHPGCVVIPAALAAAERQGASGTAFLAAVV